MPVRNVYTPDEQQVIDTFYQETKNLSGWIGDEPTTDCPNPVLNRVATKEIIRRKASVVDPWNPLWRDEEYAKKTRWGSIIAPPFFPSMISIGGGGRMFLKLPPGWDVTRWFAGTDWEFYRPILPGDSFKVWRAAPKLLDITPLDGLSPRKIRIISSDIKYINQNNEIAVKFKRYFDEIILTDAVSGRPAPALLAPDYVYCDTELSFIDKIAFDEEIYGSRIRFWEDVNVGESLKPVVLGPITPWDLAMEIGTNGFSPSYKKMSCRKIPDDGGMIDPVTKVMHKSVETHLSDKIAQLAGSTKSSITSGTSESLFGRLITNWMGDEGFIRKFSWRMLSHTHCGDSIVARAKCVKKYIEQGEYLVDISLWTESLAEGAIHHIALASVQLISKEKGYIAKG